MECSMRLNPYLVFNGQCQAAFRFYEQCLGGKIAAMMTYGDSPLAEQCGPQSRDRIMHARLQVGDTVLMGSDAPPDRFQAMQGMSVTLNIEQAAEAERVFHALAEGGNVIMPIGETFWAQRFAMLTDRFGTPWMINCEKPTG
jgi:PhnB protein